MTTEAPKGISQQAERRPRDWVPTGLTLCVWLCALPLVFLLVVPWLGVRAGVVMALALLNLEHVVCNLMAGIRAEDRTPNDVVHEVVTVLAMLSMFIAPIALIAYVFEIMWIRRSHRVPDNE